MSCSTEWLTLNDCSRLRKQRLAGRRSWMVRLRFRSAIPSRRTLATHPEEASGGASLDELKPAILYRTTTKTAPDDGPANVSRPAWSLLQEDAGGAERARADGRDT